jgi:glutathione-specific gamma-glutamylcyclotransferase
VGLWKNAFGDRTVKGKNMAFDQDPFRHHPELRSAIGDPRQSFFRTFTTAVLAEKMRGLGVPEWWYSDETREAMRQEALAGHRNADLWVFAYGSLMWDPAIEFAEVRRAYIPNYARRFILKDIYGARGNAEMPGLMAALDKGSGCDGLLFRISLDQVDKETEVLWRREQVGPAYTPVFVKARVDETPIEALTFVADYNAELIDQTISREEQIRFLATGTGFAGSSMDYLRNIHKKFTILNVHDEEVDSLLRAAEAFLASQ